jgi:hypothetical protein
VSYANKKAYLKEPVVEHLRYYAEDLVVIIDRWDEKLYLQTRLEGGDFNEYKENMENDLDTADACRDNWKLIVPGIKKTGHALFTELLKECSEEAIARLRKRVEQIRFSWAS